MIEDEDIFCAPDGGTWKRRLLGYCVPSIIAIYAVFGFLTEKVFFPRGGIVFVSYAAKFLALSYASAACFFYFHYGWGLDERLCMRSFRPKIFAAVVFLLFFVAACYFQFVLLSNHLLP